MKKILFISLSCVGDAVMTTPVLQSLHELYPQAEIDIVADRRSKDVFVNCPYRGEIFFKEKERFLRGAPALVWQLLACKYDLAVDLRTDGLAYLLRAKKRFTKFGAEAYGPHAIEQMMGVIRAVHEDRPIPGTQIWLDEKVLAYAEQQLQQFKGKPFLALGPGCGGRRPQKFWPCERYAELAESLKEVFAGVLFVGGRDDKKLAEKIAGQIDQAFIDTCGKTEIIEVAALLKSASFFVGSDSGLGHVAGAVGTPTLSFFSVDTPQRCLPWGPSPQYLVGDNNDARNISVDEARKTILGALPG